MLRVLKTYNGIEVLENSAESARIIRLLVPDFFAQNIDTFEFRDDLLSCLNEAVNSRCKIIGFDLTLVWKIDSSFCGPLAALIRRNRDILFLAIDMRLAIPERRETLMEVINREYYQNKFKASGLDSEPREPVGTVWLGTMYDLKMHHLLLYTDSFGGYLSRGHAQYIDLSQCANGSEAYRIITELFKKGLDFDEAPPDELLSRENGNNERGAISENKVNHFIRLQHSQASRTLIEIFILDSKLLESGYAYGTSPGAMFLQEVYSLVTKFHVVLNFSFVRGVGGPLRGELGMFLLRLSAYMDSRATSGARISIVDIRLAVPWKRRELAANMAQRMPRPVRGLLTRPSTAPPLWINDLQNFQGANIAYAVPVSESLEDLLEREAAIKIYRGNEVKSNDVLKYGLEPLILARQIPIEYCPIELGPMDSAYQDKEFNWPE